MAKTFGIDIGTSTIKAVWLEKDGNSLKFKSSIMAPTPAKGMLSEASLDQEEVAQTIRKMVSDAKISPRNVHIALPDNQVFEKVIEMPVLSDKELASAIYWEAEQHIPVPLNSISLDWKVLRKDDPSHASPKMLVLLVGGPTHIIRKYQEVFEYAGMDIAGLETEILAVIRTLVVSESFPTSLIVNIGSLGTSIAIIQRGTIVLLYAIPLGGTAMNRAIATEFGFTSAQAEEYKKSYGIDENNFGGKIKAAIEPILLSMITEVKKTVSFYSERYKGENSISQIILTGGTAKLPGIIPLFVEQIGLETAVSNPWKSAGVTGVPQDLLDRAPEYTIAVGLAMKEL